MFQPRLFNCARRTLQCFHRHFPRKDATDKITSKVCCRPVSSVIYADHYDMGNTAVVDLDLDLKSRFHDIETLHTNVKQRGLEHINVYHVASKFKTLRDIGAEKEKLDNEREEIATEMSHLVKQEMTEARKNRKNKLISRGREVRETLKQINKVYYELEEEITYLGLQLPVDLHPWTPLEDDRLDKQFGAKPDLPFKALSHIELGRRSGTIHQREVGPFNYYLTDDLAHLELDIASRASQMLDILGFTQMSCPGIVKTITVEGSGLDINVPDRVYILKDKGIPGTDKDELTWNITKYLAGVSPLGFASYLTKMNTEDAALPQTFFSVGKNYNPNRNNKELGLFATPEAFVVELCGIGKNAFEANELYMNFETVVSNIQRQLLGDLSTRMINVTPKSLALNESGRVDTDVWSPWLERHVSVGSISSCSDFMARRLMAKWSPQIDKVVPGNNLHIVHATALNVTAIVGLLMETHQTEDGHYHIPENRFHIETD